MTRYFLLSTILCFCTCAYSQIRLPRLISDGVVLQRDKELTLWGWASVGESVNVEIAEKKFNTVADHGGKWKIRIPAQAAGGPYVIKLRGKNAIDVADVMFGDVWLCSGQSNMELTMERVKEKYGDVIAKGENANIRQFLVPDLYDFNVQHDDISDGKWVKATPTNLLSFSAVAYFFAFDLYQQYHVPIGLINAALGGSPIEAWMSEDALKEFPEAHAELQRFKDNNTIAQIETQDKLRSQQWYKELNAVDSGLIQTPKWYNVTRNNKWATTTVPGNFPTSGNGSVWFRKEIDLPASFDGKPVKLWLGRLIDQDSVFVNGKFAATTGYQYPPRRYDVRPGMFRPGKNEIAIRLINTSGVGGFAAGKRYYVAAGSDTVNLEGVWHWRRGAIMPPLQGPTFVRWKPSGLFNKMISPLTSFPIKGAIWYQGESNTGDPTLYDKLLPAMISDWRGRWGDSFPFLYVQLPNYATGHDKNGWPEIRNAQLRTLSVTSTGMAVAIDAGEWNDLHPLNKKTIGGRLALLARKIAYGESKLQAKSPVAVKAVAKGSIIEITFDQVLNEKLASTRSVSGVEATVNGKDFVPVKAQLKGKKMTVTVPQDHLLVLSIRYAWKDQPESIDLYNLAGLPASPFIIDVQK